MRNTMRRLSALAIAVAATTGCDGSAKPAADTAQANQAEAQASATPAAAPACGSGEIRFKVTGLCQSEAAALLVNGPGARPSAPDGCAWTIEETAMTDGTALLYRGARCESRTTALKYVAGSPIGRFMVEAYPYPDVPADNEPLVQLTTAADAKALLAAVRPTIGDQAERGRCQLRPAAIESWPSDAMVVDEVPPPPADGVRSACGPLGLDEDSQTFWRLSQGKGWFFQLGQESSIVDPTSFTLVTRGKNGVWSRS